MTHHTGASRVTVATLLTLTVLQLEWSDVATGAGAGTAAVPAAITLLAAVLLARVSCFETRLLAVVVCGAQVAGVVLALVAGLPGGSQQTLDAQAVEGLLLPAVALVLLAVDRRTRRTAAPVAGVLSPYAR